MINKNQTKYRDVELFAGAGGLALGLEKAGFEAVALNEIDHTACETLRSNRKNWNVFEEDVVALADKDCCEIFNIKKGELDLLSGGYPCQSFSYAGNKGGLSDVRGTMFSYYAKILEQLMPKMFLAENVRGLVTHDGGKTIAKMIEVFTNIGYKVQYKIMNAWHYGVGQKRERVAIVGIRNNLSDKLNYKFPEPHDYKPVLRDVLKDVPKSIGAKYLEKKVKVFELVPPGGCWRSLPLEIQKEYLAGSFHLGGGKTGIARKISWDEPSLTLTCSPSQKQTDRCHPDEVRPFTVREYARIQSFPDEWQFSGSLNNQYKQIGNAVPVEFAKEIGRSIIRCFEEESK